MTELDLGGLFATADILTTPFDRKFPMLVAKFASLSESADKFAASSAQVDRALAGNAAAADKAAVSTKRNTDTTTRAAVADNRAAAASRVRSEALMRVNAVLASVADETTRVQQATLRDFAAQEKLGAAYTRTGSQAARLAAETARIASSQAAAIGTSERLAAAQRAEAAAAGEATVAGGRLRTGLAGIARTAGELGVLVGAIELVKKALDISHEATQFQASITRIQTQAGAAASELDGFSQSLLKMAPGVAQAPEALATSLYHVYSATKALGYTGPQMLKAVDIAAKGATVSGADLEQTTNALTATMVSGLGSVNNMGKAMGALNAIVGAGDMKLQDLNEALGTGILAVSKVFGVTLAQAGAALAVFGDNNIRGAKAATTLRMVIQDLTKPAASADEVLGKIGLTVTSLRDDLEKGGLSLALQHLKTNLDQAGVTGNKVGGFIEDAFTKKAGVGLAMLLNNLDQYNQKQTQITDGARNFGAEWTATTKTARYALDRLWTSIEAGGIAIAGKLSPAVAKAAMWLGTAVPHALSVLAHALGPTVHAIGTGLVDAFKVVIAILRPVTAALGAVGRFLGQHAVAVRTFALAIGTMWAAWKGYTIATTALTAIRVGFGRWMSTAPLALASLGTSLSTLATRMGPLGLAVTGISIALIGATTHSNVHADALAREKDLTDLLTDSINANTGALNKQGRAAIDEQLQSSGAFDAARQLGASLGLVKEAAMGQAGALKELYKQVGITAQQQNLFNRMDDTSRLLILDSSNATDKRTASQIRLFEALGVSTGAVKAATQAARNKAAADAGAATKTGLLDRAAEQLGFAADGTIKPLTGAGSAAKGLGKSMDDAALSGKKLADAVNNLGNHAITAAQANIAFKQAGLGLKDSLDKQNKSLVGVNTAAEGNKSAMIDALVQAKAAAAATASQSHGAISLSKALEGNIGWLRGQAQSAGVSTKQFDALVKRMHLVPHTIETKILNNAQQTILDVQRLQTFLNNLDGNVYTVSVNENINVGAPHAHGHFASGGTVPGSGRGDVVPAMLEPQEEVTRRPMAIKYRPLLKAIAADRVQMFASGGTVSHAQSSAASTAVTKASDALTAVGLSSSSFSWAKFTQQIAAAVQAVAAAMRTKASTSELTSLRDRLKRAEQKGNELERKLGVAIHGAANKLGGSLANLRNVSSVSDIRGQIHTLEGLLRQAGLPKAFINGLDQENRHILALVKVRDQAARGLAKANSAMAAARAHEMNDYRSFSAASRGAFDITNPVASGKRITAGSLRAGEGQALTRVRMWVSGITKLAGKHIFPGSYLRQLAGGGPTPENIATVQALLSMSGSGLRSFAADERQIAQLSNQGARVVAGRLDSHQLRVADRRVQHAQERETRAQEHVVHAIDHLGHVIVDELQHLHIESKIKGGDLVQALRHGAKVTQAHHRTGRNPVWGMHP